MDRSKISPDAEVSGASYLTGPRTAVGPGAVVRDSRLHDAVVEEAATVLDSIFVAEDRPRSHRCDAAGRTVVSGADQPRVARGAHLSGCTLINASVAERTRVSDTWGTDCRLGSDGRISDAKLYLAGTGPHVTITGPTEISEAYLGHHTTLERRGYFEGVFSNTFRQLSFDESSGRLEVIGTIDLPHVSRYGTNTINSTNSGKLLAQADGEVRGFGRHVGLWHDPLLSHEQVELGPCCWVAPWTKVIGQSNQAHAGDEQLVNDELMTYLMPFSVGGVSGELTRGLVMPGELSVGLGPKQRRGAWAFTYAVDAVISMVRRLHEGLEPHRKAVADTIVVEALRTAMAMTKAMAFRNRVDLSVRPEDQRPGWPRWIATTHALLAAHLEADLWAFADGRPTGWRRQSGRWMHPRIERLLAVAPDALESQVTEAEILGSEDPVPGLRVAVPAGAVEGTGGEPQIDPGAEIAPDAFIGPGCRIGPGTIVQVGAAVWNSVLHGCNVGPRARIERSILSASTVGAETTVRSCRASDSVLLASSTADSASMACAQLAPRTTVSAFGDVARVRTDCGTILGGIVHDTEIGTYLMSMHMAGSCRHLKALPTAVALDGRRVLVPAIPMIGGGSIIRGTPSGPVEMECCFIGSNAILEPNTYVGFGCFVLGALGPDAGLPPFTISTGGGPSRHQIGGVLGALASTVMTHFINWTYQAVGPEGAPGVAEMVRQSILRGIRLVEWELARRSGGGAPSVGESSRHYRSLPHYSDEQLQTALRTYQRSLDSGAWEITCKDGQLWFSSGKGRWLERSGNAFWKAR